MKRVEIILSQAIDEDFLLLCREKKVAAKFTKIPSVLGKGCSPPKMGDSIWPQFNCMYIMYCEESEAQILESIAELLQKEHPDEGAACFVS